MPERVRVKQLASDAGYDTVADALEEWVFESVVPACCSEGCEVEPDGKCPHGFPSALIAVGLI